MEVTHQTKFSLKFGNINSKDWYVFTGFTQPILLATNHAIVQIMSLRKINKDNLPKHLAIIIRNGRWAKQRGC